MGEVKTLDKLWGELKSDEERLEFLKQGRAVQTGIIAPAVVPSLIDAFERLIHEDGR